MTLPEILLAFGLVIVAVALSARTRTALEKAKDAERTAARRADAAREDLQREIDTLRRLLARVAAGEPLTPEMIADGQLWRDVPPQEAEALLASDAPPFLLDVRTPDETRGGVIKGATLIPMDEIPDRTRELPADGRPLLVYCAAGGRSAAVCDMLSREGFDGLMNLTGGFGEWTGERESPPDSAS